MKKRLGDIAGQILSTANKCLSILATRTDPKLDALAVNQNVLQRKADAILAALEVIDSDEADQEQIDARTIALQQINLRSRQAIARIEQAISSNQH